MAGTNVTFVAAHTQPKVLCKTISVSTMASSNVNSVTNHTLQNCYCNFISIPNIDRNKLLCKSVVVFDHNPADLLFPISIWTFQYGFFFSFFFSIWAFISFNSFSIGFFLCFLFGFYVSFYLHFYSDSTYFYSDSSYFYSHCIDFYSYCIDFYMLYSTDSIAVLQRIFFRYLFLKLPTAQGNCASRSFANYVDKFLAFFDHLLTPLRSHFLLYKS